MVEIQIDNVRTIIDPRRVCLGLVPCAMMRKRFTSVATRNFSSYARRSAKLFDNGDVILRQLKRFEREAEREFQCLKDLDT